MIRRSMKFRSLLAVALLSMTALAINCSKGDSGNADTGSLHLALSAPGGYTVTTVDYSVTDGSTPANVIKSGTFDVSDPNAAASLDLALPPSTGDHITLTAHAVGGHTFTGTSSAFNIVSGQTTIVAVTLTDQAVTPTLPDGVVIVNGTIVANDNPPIVDSVVVAPSQTSVGANISVSAVAHDPDSGDTVTFLWSATPNGTFASATSASTTFSSTSAGTKTITLTVSDNRGASVIVSNLTVNFLAGAGGAGGSATGSGGAAGGSVGSGGAAGGSVGGGGAAGGSVGSGGAAGGSVGRGGAAGGSVGSGGSGTASNVGADGLFVPASLVAAADFELNSDAALAAFLDCDPSKLSGNTTIVDSAGNSWGPNTLGSLGQKLAFTALAQAINQTLGGSLGVTGVGDNASNNAAGNRVINGGLLGLGVNPSAITSGTFNGPAHIVYLYKKAAVADNLGGGALVAPTTETSADGSANAVFGSAIAPVTTNPTTAIGLADNIFQCALTASIGVDSNGVVLPVTPATFVHNVVEDLK